MAIEIVEIGHDDDVISGLSIRRYTVVGKHCSRTRVIGGEKTGYAVDVVHLSDVGSAGQHPLLGRHFHRVLDEADEAQERAQAAEREAIGIVEEKVLPAWLD